MKNKNKVNILILTFSILLIMVFVSCTNTSNDAESQMKNKNDLKKNEIHSSGDDDINTKDEEKIDTLYTIISEYVNIQNAEITYYDGIKEERKLITDNEEIIVLLKSINATVTNETEYMSVGNPYYISFDNITIYNSSNKNILLCSNIIQYEIQCDSFAYEEMKKIILSS